MTHRILSTGAEADSLWTGICNIRFAIYKCTDLLVPSTFSSEDLRLRRKNAVCYGDDILHFQKSWLMKQADLPERHAIEVLLRGLKRDVTVNIETMNSGFHKEKMPFLKLSTF